LHPNFQPLDHAIALIRERRQISAAAREYFEDHQLDRAVIPDFFCDQNRPDWIQHMIRTKCNGPEWACNLEHIVVGRSINPPLQQRETRDWLRSRTIRARYSSVKNVAWRGRRNVNVA
jgi:hypothetical protein